MTIQKGGRKDEKYQMDVAGQRDIDGGHSDSFVFGTAVDNRFHWIGRFVFYLFGVLS